MAISFHPRAGQILVCDFRGYEVSEIVKIRPVMVVSPKLPNRSHLATVVPISLTPPRREVPFVVRSSKNYQPAEADDLPCWAKCDLLANVSLARLNGFKIGRRKWATPQATGPDLHAVRLGVVHGLGLGGLLASGS